MVGKLLGQLLGPMPVNLFGHLLGPGAQPWEFQLWGRLGGGVVHLIRFDHPVQLNAMALLPVQWVLIKSSVWKFLTAVCLSTLIQ